MKKLFLLFFVLLFAGQVFAETPLVRDPEQSIIINPRKIGHLDQPILFDQPDVYLDTSNACDQRPAHSVRGQPNGKENVK